MEAVFDDALTRLPQELLYRQLRTCAREAKIRAKSNNSTTNYPYVGILRGYALRRRAERVRIRPWRTYFTITALLCLWMTGL